MSLPLWFSLFNQTSIRTEVLVAKGRGGFLAAESSGPFRSSQRCSVHHPALDVASLTRSPPSFRGPCTQGHPRCFSCSVSSPGSSSTLLPCWGLPAPRFLPPLHRRPPDEPVSEHRGIHSDLLEWKRNWLQGGQLTQQKKTLNRPDLIRLGTEPFPGARNLQAASLGHGHQMPRICDTLSPCPSAQDSGSEERSSGRLCGCRQTFSPSAGTQGWPPSAFCCSVVTCLRARLALLEVWLHHIHPSVWPWHAAQAWYLHLLLWKMGQMIAAPPQRAWREQSEWCNRTLPGSWGVSNKCQLVLLLLVVVYIF